MACNATLASAVLQSALVTVPSFFQNLQDQQSWTTFTPLEYPTSSLFSTSHNARSSYLLQFLIPNLPGSSVFGQQPDLFILPGYQLLRSATEQCSSNLLGAASPPPATTPRWGWSATTPTASTCPPSRRIEATAHSRLHSRRKYVTLLTVFQGPLTTSTCSPVDTVLSPWKSLTPRWMVSLEQYS